MLDRSEVIVSVKLHTRHGTRGELVTTLDGGQSFHPFSGALPQLLQSATCEPFNHCTIEEMRIALALVQRAIACGYVLGVNDGEEITVMGADNVLTVCNALNTTELDHLIIYDPLTRLYIGSVTLIWGNGEDLISDHTDNAAIARLVEGL